MLRKLLSCVIFLYTSFCFSQEFSISGTVNDSNTKSIAYANVILVSKANLEIIKGTITDDFGAFKIENVDKGDYTITLSFL